MHLRILAVGDRQPGWVNDGVARYSARLPRAWQFRLDTIATSKRGKRSAASRAAVDEGRLLLSRLQDNERLVLLDERGSLQSSRELAQRLGGWQDEGINLCFVIGGPDGVSDEIHDTAHFRWSLSPLTLPHGLVRIVLVEQLYRAWSIQNGHPYHRD